MPVIIKPVDGFGSQNIFALRHPADLALLRQMPHIIADAPGAYGLGVVAHGAMLVERLLEGQLVGCDTMSSAGQHRLLGVNEKLFFPAPSFAIAGGCFTANCGQFAGLEAYVFGLLDAIGFDHGAAHIEIMLTPDGPMLVEINPRLVGARIPRLISAALGRCVHDDVMVLHTMGELPPPASTPMHAVTRWVVANEPGILAEIRLPHVASPGFVQATMLARPGQAITPPFDNADRLGFVMTRHTNRATAEALAEQIVAQTQVVLAPAAAA
jgi:biotin carboxylase